MFCHSGGAVLNDDAGNFCGKCGSPHAPGVQTDVVPSVTPLVAPSFSTAPRSLRQVKLFCVISAALILGWVISSIGTRADFRCAEMPAVVATVKPAVKASGHLPPATTMSPTLLQPVRTELHARNGYGCPE